MFFRLYKRHDGSFDAVQRAANSLGMDKFLGNRDTQDEAVDLIADRVGGATVVMTIVEDNNMYIEYDAS